MQFQKFWTWLRLPYTILFIGVLAFEIAYFGFHEAIIAIPHEAEQYFEFLPWAILGLLLADIYVKYRKLD